MGLLSNLLGFADGNADHAASLTVRPALIQDVEPALRLILTPPGGSADNRAINDFLSYSRERGLDFDGLHVALRRGKIISALLPVTSPGRTTLILAPHGNQSKAMDAATQALIDPVSQYCASQGVLLAQTLVDPQDQNSARIFTEHGFDLMAELYYLHATPSAQTTFPPLPEGLSWLTYSTKTHALFGRAILDSYQNSLDCPALNGRRDIEDILAGHRSCGAFEAEMWLLLREGDSSLGVLLVSQSLRSDSAELVYLGLSPPARGRKLGELMMRQALALVASRKLSPLALAVDSRNAPALKLYYRHGMQRVASKLALLRDLRNLPAREIPDLASP